MCVETFYFSTETMHRNSDTKILDKNIQETVLRVCLRN